MVGNEVREKSLLQRVSDVCLEGLPIAFLFIVPWFYGLTRFRDKLLAQIFIFSLFLVSTPFLIGRRDSPRRGDGSFDIFIFLSLLVSSFYVIFSILPYQSLLAFLQFVSCVLFYYLIRGFVRSWKRFLTCLYVVLAVGFFYSIYGLLQYLGLIPHAFWDHPESLASRFVNGGHFGTFLLFSLFCGLSLLVSERKTLVQFVLIFLLMVIGGALLLTRARAVWLASFVGLGVFLWLAARNQVLDRRTSFGMGLLAIGGGVLLFLGKGMEKMIQRFGELWMAIDTPLSSDKVQFYSLLYRREIWKGALEAIRDEPWGRGLATFSSIYPRYRIHSDRFFIDYAHNEFLQVAVDLGIPGLLLLIGFLILYLRKTSSFLRTKEIPPSQKAIGAGFIALGVSLFLVSQVDFPLRIYAIGILFATFLGLSAYLFEGPPSRFFKKGWGVIPWILVFAANFVVARQLFAELHFNEGERLERNLSWKEAQVAYEKAVRISPFFARYREALGYLYEDRAKITFDEDQRKALLQKAIHAYKEASRLEPYRAVTHYFLGLLYEGEGDTLLAQAEFLKAIAWEPTNAVFVVEYAYFAARHSLAEEAIGAFEKARNLAFHGEARIDYNEFLKLCYRLTQDYFQLRRIIPDHPSGHGSLGRLMGEGGQWDHARKELEIAMKQTKELYPASFEAAARDTAKFYLSHNRFREALEIYQELAVRNPHDEEIKGKIEEIHGRLSQP